MYLWVQEYVTEIGTYFRWYWKSFWQIDETYLKVKGKWVDQYKAITKDGKTVDFYLSRPRNAKAVKRFQCKAPRSIKSLKDEGLCSRSVQHRQVECLNNRIEFDHGKLKRFIIPTRGFQLMEIVDAILKGFEQMRMFRKNRWIFGVMVVG